MEISKSCHLDDMDGIWLSIVVNKEECYQVNENSD